jgi:dTDP-glucose 4,6-dehydratase
LSKRILITGGAGFIGHHVVEHILKNTDWQIVVLDRLTYASRGLNRLRDIQAFDDRRVLTLTADLAAPMGAGLEEEIGELDYIVHLAAETHVDNSIADPWPFVRANVIGTFHMLELARRIPSLERFVYFSTDEVFGPAPSGVAYKEWDRYNSTNPYSASKAGGEELCLAWANTYKLPVIITHTMNAFGERQHPEKFIPKVVRKVLAGEPVTIHADQTRTISGSRFWIHCRNIASAMLFLLERGESREKYNIVGEREVSNLELAQKIAAVLGKPLNYEMVDFHSSRPGHDLRYALDGARMTELGWRLPVDFEHSLEKTIRWMIHPDHARWLEYNEVAKPASRPSAG